MSLSNLVYGTDSIGVDIEGVKSTVPYSLINADYQRILGLGWRKIELENGVYNAFPSAIFKSGSSLAAIFSSGAGHGNSDRQIAIRSDDEFETFERSVFFEDATAAYDFSFLNGMMNEGDVWPFKNVFKVRKTADGHETKIQSTVVVTGQGANNGTYALWSAAPLATGGKLYCTGYRTSPTPWTTALFESGDSGWTWTFTAVIASDPALMFNEAAIVKCLNGDLIAVIREDAGAGRPLYLSRCASGFTSWSTPVLLSGMQGTQPCLLLMPDGDVLLIVGHRTGSSGLDAAGRLRDQNSNNHTGIAVWRSTNHGVSWHDRVMLAPMWSTDGGQPMAVVLDSGKVGVLCYLAPWATNGDGGFEPGIYWLTFNGDNLV
ncbi:MAG TPA: sialidase family protein [Dehalococcoidia bacterium]|nr:sialidase family protein [Dehalococcoidia bacterium]